MARPPLPTPLSTSAALRGEALSTAGLLPSLSSIGAAARFLGQWLNPQGQVTPPVRAVAFCVKENRVASANTTGGPWRLAAAAAPGGACVMLCMSDHDILVGFVPLPPDAALEALNGRMAVDAAMRCTFVPAPLTFAYSLRWIFFTSPERQAMAMDAAIALMEESRNWAPLRAPWEAQPGELVATWATAPEQVPHGLLPPLHDLFLAAALATGLDGEPLSLFGMGIDPWGNVGAQSSRLERTLASFRIFTDNSHPTMHGKVMRAGAWMTNLMFRDGCPLPLGLAVAKSKAHSRDNDTALLTLTGHETAHARVRAKALIKETSNW